MMLRVSSEAQDETVDLHAITEGTDVASGVPGETELLGLVEETVLSPGSDTLPQRRSAVADALGEAALVDAAAVIGNFQRMTRIADGTGIPLDDMVVAMTTELREEIGINQYGSAAYTREASLFKRVLVKMIWPLMARRMRKSSQQTTETAT